MRSEQRSSACKLCPLAPIHEIDRPCLLPAPTIEFAAAPQPMSILACAVSPTTTLELLVHQSPLDPLLRFKRPLTERCFVFVGPTRTDTDYGNAGMNMLTVFAVL